SYSSALAFSPDSRALAIVGSDTVVLWDTTSRQKLAELKGHLSRVHSMTFCPDGRIASGGADCTVRVWPLDSGNGSYPQGRVIGAHLDAVTCVAASPDGKLLASGQRMVPSNFGAWPRGKFRF